MIKKKYLSICLVCILCATKLRVNAQSENRESIDNDGGTISSIESWQNTTSGIYHGYNNGRFIHSGPPKNTFVNSGEYEAGTGHTDMFNGFNSKNSDQEISGETRADFFNLAFTNGISSFINISSTSGISVKGILNFENGITTTVRNLHQKGSLHFHPGATYLNAETDQQHVNGYVSKEGSEAFIFPVGSGTDLRKLAISAPIDSSTLITVAWISGDPSATIDPSDNSLVHSTLSVESPIVSVSSTGQWDWIQTEPSTNPLKVTVSIPNLELFDSGENLRLVGWNVDRWIDLSGKPTASGNVENSTLEGVIPITLKISAIAIGRVSTPLPVELASFSVNKMEIGKVRIVWTTSNEEHHEYFQIEHSQNAINFVNIGTVKGNGGKNTTATYLFVHELPFAYGRHYYRLKQIDFDKTYSLSKIVAVNFGEPDYTVFPNPAQDKLKIELVDLTNLEGIYIYNLSGDLLYQSREKKNTMEISTKELKNGIYLLQIQYKNSISQIERVFINK